ncbi:TPA: biliverdin-producing heme oxygenase, partial [Pseudomonas aeruginosa]|nr:biliverdin-producing heme oxygenase [Pseudomonas aeruginosa]
MSPSPSPALAALRDATRDLHAELDRRSPLGDDDLDDRAYLDHAGRILGWLEPLERALRDNRSGWPAALRADARLVKSAWLESDLLAGGMS